VWVLIAAKQRASRGLGLRMLCLAVGADKTPFVCTCPVESALRTADESCVPRFVCTCPVESPLRTADESWVCYRAAP
jgi:hypothetical protein